MDPLTNLALGNIRLYDVIGGGPVIGSVVINAYSALAVPAYWRALNFLSTNLASFPRSVHKDGAKAGEPHPIDSILRRRPNDYQNPTAFWRTLFMHAAHAGNGYAEISRDAMLNPAGLHNLLPTELMPFRYDRGDGGGPQQYYLHRPGNRVLPGADVIHLSALGFDGMAGFDPVALHHATFERAATIDRYQTRYLQRGTVLRGAIQIPQGVSDDQVEQIVTKLRTYFSGAEAERDVIVLSDGATLNNATLSPQQSQLIEQAAYTTKQIAQLTGVPPQFLYEFGESKYNNSIEQMGQDVVRYTFRPWLDQVEDELTVKLLSTAEQDDGYAVRLNPDALLRGDTKTQTDTVIATVNGGLRTRNEGRALLDLAPDPDAESDKLRTLGATTPQMPEPPRTSAATPPGERAAFAGQWKPLDGETMTLVGGWGGGEGDGQDDAGFRVNVHDSGAIGKTAAQVYFPLGATVDVATAFSRCMFAVTDHAPHDHPNWVVPTLTQTAGPRLPGNPSPIHLGHVARMAAASRLMGQEATVSVHAPAGVPTPAAAPYAALRPILDAACARVDAKTAKAFETHGKKPQAERTIWANVFAEQQARYAAEALGPVSEALVGLGAAPLDVSKLAEQCAFQIRRRAAGGEGETLAAIAKNSMVVGAHAEDR